MQFVVSAIAVACRAERERIQLDTALLDLQIDSLTLAAVLTQVEAVYAVELSTTDMLDLLSAATVGDLIAGIERRIQPSSQPRCREPQHFSAIPPDNVRVGDRSAVVELGGGFFGSSHDKDR